MIYETLKTIWRPLLKFFPTLSPRLMTNILLESISIFYNIIK